MVSRETASRRKINRSLGTIPAQSLELMKNKIKTISQSVLFLALPMISSPSWALLPVSHLQGSKIVQIPVNGARAEVCVIPHHLTGISYSSRDLEKETELCQLQRNGNAGVCPKLNSTNPGLNFIVPPQGVTPQKLEAANCSTPGADKVGKYKLSTSCSYTPSLLSYYHVSRMLGGVARVPPAVLRTFDLNSHIQLAQKALNQTKPGELIHSTWSSLAAQLQARGQASKRDLLLTENLDQSYGALQNNPSGEEFYREFFNGGADAAARAQNFRDRNPIVRLLADSRPATELVGRTFNAANFQIFVQMKDASEMILLDTLLSQQDRFGNIHYQMESYVIETGANGQASIKAKKPLTPAEQAQAVTVKRMILKDNDCGVSKTNIAQQAHLSDRISHLAPKTYRNLLLLEQGADRPDLKSLFMSELLMTTSDYQKFRENLRALTAQLKKSCEQGRLKLDLDAEAHFLKAAPKDVNCSL